MVVAEKGHIMISHSVDIKISKFAQQLEEVFSTYWI